MSTQLASRVIGSLALMLACTHAFGKDATLPIPPSGVIGVQEAMLSPDYWIIKAPSPDAMLMSTTQIESQNRRMFETDPSMYDLRAIGPALTRDQIEGWIAKVSKAPNKTFNMRRTKTNEVSVTPLLPLLVDEKLSYVDAMTSIVRIR